MAIEDALNIVFKEQPLSYKIINSTIVLKLKEVAQVKPSQVLYNLPPIADTIHGRVLNEKGEPMEGVTVTIKKTKRATTTNSNGEYNISAAKGSVLVFSYVNYSPGEVAVGSQTTYNMTMQPQTSSLNDVVVIGYGSRLKKDVTGAISTVTAKDIEKSTSMTGELALQGKAAGVFIESGGSNPGARPTIRIRGVNTFGFAEPLYVVDGIPIYEGFAGATDGVFEFWIDNKLQAGSYNLSWHGNWNGDSKNYMINAVLFENYWNKGSPKLQERYFDNILISSKPIKCNCD